MGKPTRICANCKYSVHYPWLRKWVYCSKYGTLVKKLAQACKEFQPAEKPKALVPLL